MKKRRIYTILALLLAFAMIFTGCSSKSETADMTSEGGVSSSFGTGTTFTAGTSDGISAAGVEKKAIESPAMAPATTAESSLTASAGAAAADGSSLLDSIGSAFGAMAECEEAASDMTTDIYEIPADEPLTNSIPVVAGTLTAGEWNDNKHFDFLQELLNKVVQDDYYYYDEPYIIGDDEIIEIPVPTDPTIKTEGFDDAESDSTSSFDATDTVETETPDIAYIPDGQGNYGETRTYADYFKDWSLTPFKRIAIHTVANDTSAIFGAHVSLLSASGDVIVSGTSDNNGMVYCYYTLFSSEAIPATVEVTAGGKTSTYEVVSSDLLDGAVKEVVVDEAGSSFAPADKALDIMYVVDTTGSMGDEISYLQVELENVIDRIKSQNGNIPVNLSVNFYRDLEDDYVVRDYPFSTNIDNQLAYLRAEYADGGGDYEEAVEQALDNAVNGHQWSEDSTKIMFLVLDAPPHNTAAVRSSLASTIKSAADKGIRIIPVASSGVDKTTEFLLRTLAMTTGGTYTFLTDDSGVGYSHMEPTVGDYEVEKLCDLMVRVVSEYLK